MTFQRPSRRNPPILSVSPRNVLSVYTPVQQQSLPDLPTPVRKPAFDTARPFTLTTHLVPAAYPRTYPDYPTPDVPPANSSKAEKKELTANNTRTLLEYQDLQHFNAGIGSRRPLWVCLNRYVRESFRASESGPRITLLLAHANGFPKEIWEPMLDHLLGLPSGSYIDEIWSWESVQHGDAALVNAKNLGGLFKWSDNTRDIVNFLLHYLPNTPTSSVLPIHLPIVSQSESHRRRVHGFAERTVVAIGHSYGGCTCALAAVDYPALFSSVLLVDPIIARPPDVPFLRSTYNLVYGALQRRDTWSSRAEALAQFRQSPFFASWDSAVLKVYVECGLTDDGRGGVKLKTSAINEAVVFADSHTAFETYALLEELDPKVALRWIMPGILGSRPDTKEEMQQRVWVRPENASNVQIPNAGHLIPQEAPRQLALDVDNFLQRHYGLVKARL